MVERKCKDDNAVFPCAADREYVKKKGLVDVTAGAGGRHVLRGGRHWES